MARTQVAIVGAGPSGLLLSQLLHQHGVDSIILERRSPEYVAGRIRAGVLEQGTVDLLVQAKVGARMLSERLVHDGFALGFAGKSFRVDLKGLTGDAVSVYGQTEVTKDLMETRIAAGGRLIFEAQDVSVEGFDRTHPTVRYSQGGRTHTLTCDFVAGCDGHHGVSRASIPADALTRYSHEYGYSWLSILAEVPASPSGMAIHSRGLAGMIPRGASASRLYLQCSIDDTL